MKRLLALCFLLVNCAAFGATVTFHLSDFGAAALNKKSFRLTSLSTPRVVGGRFIGTDTKTITADASGDVSTNLVYGNYRVDFGGSGPLAPMTTFIILVPDTTDALSAGDLIVSSITVPGATVAYSVSAADAKFLLKTNGTSTSQTLIGAQFSGSTNAFTFTNGATAGQVLTTDGTNWYAADATGSGAGLLSSNTIAVVAPGGLIATGIVGANLVYDPATRTLSATGGAGGGISSTKTNGATSAMAPTILGFSNTVGVTWGAYSNVDEITYIANLDAILSNFLGAPPPTNANAQQWSNLGTNNISNLIGATNGLNPRVGNHDTDIANLQGASNSFVRIQTGTANALSSTNQTNYGISTFAGTGPPAINLNGATSGTQKFTTPDVAPNFTNSFSPFGATNGQVLVWNTTCLCWTNGNAHSGSQTPWTTDINGGGFNLATVNKIDVDGGLTTKYVTGTTNPPFRVNNSNGVSMLFVNTNGFVGIGTTNPAQALHVTGQVQIGPTTDGTVINSIDVTSIKGSTAYIGFRSSSLSGFNPALWIHDSRPIVWNQGAVSSGSPRLTMWMSPSNMLGATLKIGNNASNDAGAIQLSYVITKGISRGMTNAVLTAGAFTNATMDSVIMFPNGTARTNFLNSTLATNGTLITVKDWLKTASGTNITVTATSGTVEGATYVMNADSMAVTFIYDGTNWFGQAKF